MSTDPRTCDHHNTRTATPMNLLVCKDCEAIEDKFGVWKVSVPGRPGMVRVDAL